MSEYGFNVEWRVTVTRGPRQPKLLLNFVMYLTSYNRPSSRYTMVCMLFIFTCVYIHGRMHACTHAYIYLSYGMLRGKSGFPAVILLKKGSKHVYSFMVWETAHRVQYPLINEYALNYCRIPNMV